MIDFTQLNWVDCAIVGVIVFSTVISFIRGFVRESLSLASWIIAFWVALTFAKPMTGYLVTYFARQEVRLAIAFFGLFIVSLILGSMLSHLISQLVQKTGLSGTDRLLGLIFGVARGVLIVALLLLLGDLMSLQKAHGWQQSVLLPYFDPIVAWLKSFLPVAAQPAAPIIAPPAVEPPPAPTAPVPQQT